MIITARPFGALRSRVTGAGASPSSISMVRLIVVMTLLSGCSAIMPRRGHAPPVFDAMVAVGGATMIAASQDSGDRQLMVAGTTMLIAFGVAALHGFDNTAAIRVER